MPPPHPAVQSSEFQKAAELLGTTEYADLTPVRAFLHSNLQSFEVSSVYKGDVIQVQHPQLVMSCSLIADG